MAGQRGPIHQHDIGAFRALDDVVRRQRFRTRLACEQQIAALAKRDIGIRAEPLLEFAEERHAERAHADVLRRGELLADRGRREGRGRPRIGRVALDHGDRAGKAEVVGEEIGDRGSDRRAADNHHVIGTQRALLFGAADSGMHDA